MEVATFKGDINDPAALDNVFKTYADDGGIWGVIHVAALKAVGESAEIPLAYYQTNISATMCVGAAQTRCDSSLRSHAFLSSLMQIMDKYKCYNLVYSSSATVYGAPKTIPIPEYTPLAPESCCPCNHGRDRCS